MNYADVYELISKYCADLLPLYADKWSRFPKGEPAIKIAGALKSKAEFYNKYDSAIGEQLEKASETARHNA